MNGPCPQMRDQIAAYVLGALDTQQAGVLRAHLADCDGCRQYAQSLKSQARSLVAFGRQIDTGMEAREDRVIEALQAMSPAEAGATRVFSFVVGFLRMAVAAVLVLGFGVGIGRWTAPRPVDVEQLQADLQASIMASVGPAVQESILSQVDQRLQASLSKNEAKLRTELANQVGDDLQRFTAQAASNSETLVDQRFAEFIQLVEEARLKDRQHMVKALEQIERNRYRDRTQIQTGLAALIEKKPATISQ
jgi:anti-sigma factor RsiW